MQTKVLFFCLFLVQTSFVLGQKLLPPPPMPVQVAQMLWDSCTAIDYTFFELPISMSVDDQPTIRQNVRHIALDGILDFAAGCKPIARIFFAKGTSIVLDADFYFQQNCTYYMYFKHGENKPIFANKMTQEGLDFFKSVSAQAAQIKKDGKISGGH